MAKISTWGATSTSPAGTDLANTIDNVIRSTRDDIYETCNINMDVTTGRLKTSATSLAVTAAGLIQLQTTAKVLELDDGTEIRPLNYINFSQMNFTTRTSATELRFSIHSGSAFTYDGSINIDFMTTLSTGATAATDTITLKYGTVLGTYGTTATAHIIGSTNTGQLHVKYSGALAKDAVFWQITIGTGVFSNTNASDHQAYWTFIGSST